jgi:hypothetical protein
MYYLFGLAYLFAMIYLFISNEGRDGKPGMSVEDIRIAYSGDREATKLEAALMGPMSRMLPPEETAEIVGWIRRGTDEHEYETQIAPIFVKRCLACHDGTNPHLTNLGEMEGVHEVAEIDTGMKIGTLVRVSHIHLFGVTFIFFIMGLIFSHAYVRPRWFKSLVVIAPFVALSLDISSWYLTKFVPSMAWVVFVGGGLMGMSFAIQWTVSMYQIWFSKYDAPARPMPANYSALIAQAAAEAALAAISETPPTEEASEPEPAPEPADETPSVETETGDDTDADTERKDES